ncbi:MAG: glucose-6-phosphate dehydrogenase [Sulfuricella sp.]|nr:glucose-6-phosphate dehydrogenase [Sulfuricella sp.]
MTALGSDAFVFFGAGGELAYQRIFPALQALSRRGRLAMPVVGVAKSGWDLNYFKARALASLESHGGVDSAASAKLLARLHYVDGDYADPAVYAQLRQALGNAARPCHYLAIPPGLFATVADGLAKSGCAKGARIIVEKPFGRDLASAHLLNRTLHQRFPESAIFRIDHFLSREAVENLLYFRFANAFLKPVWNRAHIASVQITLAERSGVAGRGHFYEEVGAIRDTVQNHLLQVVALLAMDVPAGHGPDAMRDEKLRVLRAMRPLCPAETVRGQFRGYRAENGVAPDSQVETFAALRLHIETERWAGVPFYIRVGKRLPVTCSEALVKLKPVAHPLFDAIEPGQENYFRFRLAPDFVASLGARIKAPGEAMVGEAVELVAHRDPGDGMSAYERLLGDALRGNAAMFGRDDCVEAAWHVVEPILNGAVPLLEYPPDTWGPSAAGHILGGESGWHNPA